MDSYDKERLRKGIAWVKTHDNCAEDPYAHYSNIRITELGEGYCEGEMDVTDELLNPYGYVHGGCIATMADTIAGHMIAYHKGWPVTVSSDIHYIRPAVCKTMKCRAEVEKFGRKLCICTAKLSDEEGRTVAFCTLTFSVLDQAAQARQARGKAANA